MYEMRVLFFFILLFLAFKGFVTYIEEFLRHKKERRTGLPTRYFIRKEEYDDLNDFLEGLDSVRYSRFHTPVEYQEGNEIILVGEPEEEGEKPKITLYTLANIITKQQDKAKLSLKSNNHLI